MIMLAIAVFSLFSSLVNPYWPGWELKLARLLVINGWAFLLGITMVGDSRVYSSFFTTLVAVALAIGMTAIVQGRQHLGISTLNISFTDYLGVARLTAMGAIIAFWHLQRRSSLWWLAVFVFLAGVTALSGARGPMIALGVSIVVGWLFVRAFESQRRSPVSTILIMVIVIVLLAAGLGRGLFDVFWQRMSLLGESGDSSGRMSRLLAGLEVWSQYPIFGRGANAFPIYYNSGFANETPHNLLVELGAEFGVIPLILIGGTYIWVLFKMSAIWIKEKGEGRVAFVESATLSLMLFWLIQVPLIGMGSGKYGAALHGIGLGLIWIYRPNRQSSPGKGL